MQRRPVPFFYIGPEYNGRTTGVDRLVTACVVLLTLVWSASLIWLGSSIGIIIAHFVVALVPPTVPLRPTF